MFNKNKLETELLYKEINRLKSENHKLSVSLEVYKEKEAELEKLRGEYKKLVEETKGLRDLAKSELDSYRELFKEYQTYLKNIK